MKRVFYGQILLFFSCLSYAADKVVVPAPNNPPNSDGAVTTDETAHDPRVFIPEGSSVQIESYDAKSHLYRLTRSEFPEVTDYLVTQSDLTKSIHSLDRARLKQNPNSILGNEYTLDEDLPLADPPSSPKN